MTRAPHTEIERRFLVHVPTWQREAIRLPHDDIIQFYLAAERERTVRIRLRAGRATLTVKGEAVGAERIEIECEIPAAIAQAILDARLYAATPVEKTRTTIEHHGVTWEVDEFLGANRGLHVAEAEYHGDDDARMQWEERVDRNRPDWLGREITGEHRFSNAGLAVRPFADWPAQERDPVVREIDGG